MTDAIRTPDVLLDGLPGFEWEPSFRSWDGLRLAHVDITVTDLDLATAYYTGVMGMHVTGRDAEARVAEACRAGIIVVTSSDYEAVGPCRVIDRRFLRENGAAMIREVGGQDVITVRQVSGLRRWSQ